MTNSKEHSQWRKFLHPVVTGLVTLMAAVVGYLQYLQKQDSGKMEARMTAIEVRTDAAEKRADKFGTDIDNFKVLLSDIRSDVSFIRGKLERR